MWGQVMGSMEVDHSALKNLLDSMAVAVMIVDGAGCIVHANSASARLFGWSAAELTGGAVEMLIPARLRAAHVQHRTGHRDFRPMQSARSFTAVRRDGTEVELDISLTPMTSHGERQWVAVLRDVTAALAHERSQQQRVRRLQSLNLLSGAMLKGKDLAMVALATLEDLEAHMQVDFATVCLVDAALETFEVIARGPKSQALADQMGMPSQPVYDLELTGLGELRTQDVLYMPDMAYSSWAMQALLTRHGVRSGLVVAWRTGDRLRGCIVVGRRASGAFDEECIAFFRALAEQLGVAEQYFHMVGDLRDAWRDLHAAQQTALQHDGLGTVTAGFAHDIRNALTPISGLAELTLDSEPDLSTDARMALETIRLAAADILQMARNLRKHHGVHTPAPPEERSDVGPALAQVAHAARLRLRPPSEVQVVTEIAADLPAVAIPDTDLRQILTNLVVNALDAMPDGGRLELRADADAGGVHVYVRDSGAGMDAETLRHCREPYFTTKGDQGTGLGLAMVGILARQYGGHFDIESEPGSGTLVGLTLPACACAEPA